MNTNFNDLTDCTHKDTVETNMDNEITTIPGESKFILDCNTFLGSFKSKLASLHLNEKTTNEIYKLCGELINQAHILNISLIEENPEAHPSQILSKSKDFICDKLHENSSAYRRKVKCDGNQMFVQPKELSLGVKWEMLREKTTKIAVPKLTQCKFQYISIVETLKVLFKREDFRKTYYEYNSNRGHTCTEGIFEDFCCGNLHRENQLF